MEYFVLQHKVTLIVCKKSPELTCMIFTICKTIEISQVSE